VEVVIRDMHIDDLPAMRAIECRCFSDPWPTEWFQQALVEQTICWSAIRNGSVAGYIIAFIDDDELHIANLAVDEPFRRRGIARNLIGKLIELARRNRCHYVKLEVRRSNAVAIRLYKVCGFTKLCTVRNYYIDGESAYILTLKVQ